MSKCCYCSFGWASLIIGLLLLIAGLVVQLAVMPPIYIDSMNDVNRQIEMFTPHRWFSRWKCLVWILMELRTISLLHGSPRPTLQTRNSTWVERFCIRSLPLPIRLTHFWWHSLLCAQIQVLFIGFMMKNRLQVFDYANTGGIMNRGSYPDMDEKGPYSYKWDHRIANYHW